MKISKQLSVPVSPVQHMIKKWKEQGTITNKSRMGAPRKMTPRAVVKLMRILKIYPKIPREG